MTGYNTDGLHHDLSNARLFAVAVDSDANWDYFVDYPWTDKPEEAAIWSVAREKSGARSTYFGGLDHIRKLLRNNRFNYVEFTDVGKALLEV